MIESQKFGTACPTSATVIVSRSIGLPRWVALSTPSGIASTIATTIAVTVNWNVAGSRSAISGRAGVPCRSEVPMSPWSARQRNCPYWTMIGSIEAPLAPEAGDLLGRGVRRQHQHRRIAAEERQEERDDRDAEDDQDSEQQPLHDVRGHRSHPLARPPRPARRERGPGG